MLHRKKSELLVLLLLKLDFVRTLSCVNEKPEDVAKILQGPFELRNIGLYQAFDKRLQQRTIAFAKYQFQNNQYLTFITNLTKTHFGSPIVFCADTENNDIDVLSDFARNREFATSKQVLVFSSQPEVARNKLEHVRIDQEVYVISTLDYTMTETYSVNGFVVTKLIGKYDSNGSFSKTGNGRLSFEERRGNFMGMHLKLFVDQDAPYTRLPSNYKDNYNAVDKVFKLSNPPTGMYAEIMDIFANFYNFTYTYYKREDGVWGSLDNQGQPTGIMKNLVEGSADIAAVALTVTRMRVDHIDYLPVITSDKVAIFIRRQRSEDFKFTTFVSSFKQHLWLTLGIGNVLIGIWFYVTNLESVKDSFGHDKVIGNHVASLIGYLWASFTINFGGKPKDLSKRPGTQDKIVLVSCLLTGSIVWMCYRASMTSELSAAKIKKPFVDLETLVDTDYKLLTGKLGSPTADSFVKAKPGTIYHNVFKNHMNLETSFGFAGAKLVGESEDKLAFYYAKQVTLGTDQGCKIMAVWEADKPNAHYSMAISQKSILKRFLTMATVRLFESGPLNLNANRYLLEYPNCSPIQKEAEALSFKKIGSLFIFMTLGVILAGLTFVLEKLSCKSRGKARGAKDLIRTHGAGLADPVQILDKVFHMTSASQRRSKIFSKEDIDKFETIIQTIKKSERIQFELQKAINQ